MRGRFGRRRRGGDGNGRAALDATRELARLREAGLVPAETLEPASEDGVSAAFAALGLGTGGDGRRLAVASSPHDGGDAWLAGLALATRLAQQEGFAGDVWVSSPRWPAAARRRLGLLGATSFRVVAVQEPLPTGPDRAVVPEELELPAPATLEQAAAALRAATARELFLRAAAGLAGLAAKHGGSVRTGARGLELVLLARRVATLRAAASQLSIEVELPSRSSLRLDAATLSDALDRLEGSLRKYLNDRKVREGEGAVRARLVPLLATASGADRVLRWPSAGLDPDPLDFVAADPARRPVVGAARSELGLAELGAILDAVTALAGRLPDLVEGVPAPPRLFLAAERVEPAVARVLGCLRVESVLHDVERAGRELRIALRTPEARPLPAARPAPEPRRERPPAPLPPVLPAPPGPEKAEAVEAPAGPRRFEELSIFDLAGDERSDAEPAAARRRRRRRGRGRGRRAGSSEPGRGSREGEEREEADDGEPASDRDEQPRGPLVAADAEDLEEGLAAATEPDTEPEVDLSQPVYDDEEEIEPESEEERMREEREARRRARLAKTEPEPVAAPEPPRRVRRRAALLVHADRDSLGAAVVLARDLRLIEGIWVYPQSELMTFFRSVATDLREETLIAVLGFTASPARDVIQAAALYGERLIWYDHHDWPPEDLEALRRAVGAEAVHVQPGLGSALPLVLRDTTRRSRFTDKLVDLLAGRFTRHDFERWGRLWWDRLGEIARRSGEQRARLDALLAGRPSDLAREAARVAPPPAPAEVAWVASRDFRLAHFGGYSLVRVPVPPELHAPLAARIARERYEAELAVAWTEGSERVILCGEEASGGVSLELGAMVEHLAAKFTWVEALPDTDHVARIRLEGLEQHPERLDEVVGEIAMGRSILEG